MSGGGKERERRRMSQPSPGREMVQSEKTPDPLSGASKAQASVLPANVMTEKNTPRNHRHAEYRPIMPTLSGFLAWQLKRLSTPFSGSLYLLVTFMSLRLLE